MTKGKKNKITWKVEKRNIADLKPHPKNPRHFTEKGMKDLEKSIDKIGMAQPINITQDGIILSGHARIKKLQEKGEIEVDVYVPSKKLTEKEQEEVLIRMNANTAGEWDMEKLANEFELPELTEWGLEIPQVENIEDEETINDDEAPEMPVNPITVKGDFYELGNHKLLCGDSTLIDDVKKLMGKKEADLIHTDPPYNVAIENSQGMTIKNDDMSGDDFKQFMCDVYTNLFAVCKKGGGGLYLSRRIGARHIYRGICE